MYFYSHQRWWLPTDLHDMRLWIVFIVTATALSPNSGRSMQAAAAAAAAAAANNQMAALSNGYIPTNASSVAYFDESGQVLLFTNIR